MTTFDFQTGLVMNTFNRANSYQLTNNLSKMPIFWGEDDPNTPVLSLATQQKEGYLIYSDYYYQLGGRAIVVRKLKEIMDGCPVPIRVKTAGRQYLAGKGFLADYDPHGGRHKILYVATINGKRQPSSMQDVTLYIHKEVLTNEAYKAIKTMFQGLISSFTGDICIVKDVSTVIGHHFSYPRFSSIRERRDYQAAMVEGSMDEVLKEINTKKEEEPAKRRKVGPISRWT